MVVLALPTKYGLPGEAVENIELIRCFQVDCVMFRTNDTFADLYGLELLNDGLQQARDVSTYKALLNCFERERFAVWGQETGPTVSVRDSYEWKNLNPRVSEHERAVFLSVSQKIIQPVIAVVKPVLIEGQEVPFCVRRGMYLFIEACRIFAQEATEAQVTHYEEVIRKELGRMQQYVVLIYDHAFYRTAVFTILKGWSQMIERSEEPSLQVIALTEGDLPIQYGQENLVSGLLRKCVEPKTRLGAQWPQRYVEIEEEEWGE